MSDSDHAMLVLIRETIAAGGEVTITLRGKRGEDEGLDDDSSEDEDAED